RLQVRFMEEKIGATYEGIISGVTDFGLFIELLDHFISGAVEIAKLKDDYYRFDESHYRLVGSRTNKVYQIGDLVRIKVAGVDSRQQRISFELE
ncbi:MAG: S1 RNA-binding domain-containing protein, partial [Desulfobulbales bacterium]|nr:S1 RNA-binding domain-containing protein [Desulfobulbales bacterium]